MGAPRGNKNAAGPHKTIRVSGKSVRRAARKAYATFYTTKSERRSAMRKFRKSGGGRGFTIKSTSRPYRKS